MDFSFMKTGFSNLVETNPTNKEFMEMGSILLAFMKSGLKNSATYVEHAGRTGITPTDAKLGLQLEVFQFSKREGTPDNIKETLEWLEKDIEEHGDFDERSSEEDEEDDELVDEIIVPFTKSNCKCSLCNQMNAMEFLWSRWEPDTPINKILKSAIDKMHD